MLKKQKISFEDYGIDDLVSVSDHLNFSHLEGKLLTIIDASFSDKTQRDSVKSLVRQVIWDWASKLPLHEKALIGKNYNTKE